MNSLPTLSLKPKMDRRVRGGHPWFYSNEVQPVEGQQFSAGAQVSVLAADGTALGSAFYSPQSLLCGRFYASAAGLALDATVLSERIASALRLRESFYSEPFYRLVYGDGDQLPGLVVDRYGEYLVVQITAAGMWRLRSEIVSVLVELVAPRGILLSIDDDKPAESLEAGREIVFGEVPEVVSLRENGVDFQVPLREGQKTGWFYDHRDNRRRLSAISAGKSVLDVFAYLGGWGLQAAAAGASSVVCVDSSALSLSYAEQTAKRMAYADAFTALRGQANDVLKQLLAEGRQFDVIVLDPPAFIKRRKDSRRGETAYHQVNQLAMRLLAPEGVLVSASCSLHLSVERLEAIVHTAAKRTGRQLSLLASGGLGADHPVHPAVPEMRYLKAVFAVARG